MLNRLNYEQLYRSFRWKIPGRYNIAADVCDRHARDPGKVALIGVGDDGKTWEMTFREVNSDMVFGTHTPETATAGLVHEEPGRAKRREASEYAQHLSTPDVDRDAHVNCPTIAMNAGQFERPKQPDHHVL